MFCSTTALRGNCSAASAARDATPIFFPEKKNGRRPSKRKAFLIAGEQLEELQCLPDCTTMRAALPRLVLLYDLAYFYYPLPLCSSCFCAA